MQERHGQVTTATVEVHINNEVDKVHHDAGVDNLLQALHTADTNKSIVNHLELEEHQQVTSLVTIETETITKEVVTNEVKLIQEEWPDILNIETLTRPPLKSLTSDDSSTYPEVFTSTPSSPLTPASNNIQEGFPMTCPSNAEMVIPLVMPSVDSPVPRPTMSSFRPSSSTISSYRPDSLDLTQSPGVFSYTKGMAPGSFCSKGNNPSHEEIFPKQLPQHSTLGSMWSSSSER